jgi:hypothetical protein
MLKGSSEKRLYEQFKLLDGGFAWKGNDFKFTQIKHLLFVRVATTHSVNCVKVGVAQSAALRVIVETGEEINLDFNEAGFFVGSIKDKKVDIKNLEQLYLYLAQCSFDHRLANYLRELEFKGYFTVGDCKFYPRDKIVHQKTAFPLDSITLLKGAGYVEIRKKNQGLWEKIKNNLTVFPQINSRIDTDVLFHLLDKLFGIRWKN